MSLGLRPLTTGQVLDRTFQIYRSKFMLFAGISALPQAALLVLQLGLLAMLAFGSNVIAVAAVTAIAGLGFLIISIVVSSIATAATTFAVSDIYLDKPTSIGSCFSRVRGKIGRVAWTSLEFGLRVGVGIILLILPGIYFAGKWGLAVPAVVLEPIDRQKAFPRAAALSDGSIGRVLVVFFLTWILIFGLSMGFGFVLAAVAPALSRAAGSTASMAVQYILSAIVNSVVAPVMHIALTVLYYDQRVRKEGFDIENMMTMLGERTAGATAAAATAN
jgi:hypothetical protein